MAAGWDPTKYEQLWRTPLREVCLSAAKRLAGEQMTHYLLEGIIFALGGSKKPPEEPLAMKGKRWLL